MDESSVINETRLMSALIFTADELAANRDGYMSKRQRAVWSNHRAMWAANRRFVVIALVVAILIGVWSSLWSRDVFTNMCCIVTLILLVGGTGYYYTDSEWQKRNRDLTKGDVAVLEGELRMSKYWDRNMKHRLFIQGKEFIISGFAYTAFQQGKRFRIYYAPNSKRILSAEELEDLP